MQTARALLREVVAAPERVRGTPIEDRALMDKLKGKRVCIVVDDTDYLNGMKDLVEGMLGRALLVSETRVLNWSSFLCILPDMRADLVVLLSPRDLGSRLEGLESGIMEFRKANPHAVVLMNNLHSPAAPASVRLHDLRRGGLMDHIEQGFTFFPHLIHQAADALDAKV